MIKCKCRICGKELNSKTAYNKPIKGKNKYYCSKEEYDEYTKNKERAKMLKTDIKTIICDILNIDTLVCTYIYKEWKIWNEAASDEVILDYLKENKVFLHDKVSLASDNEFAKIKYLSSILRNSLQNNKEVKKIQRKIKEDTIEEYIAKYLDPNLSFHPDVPIKDRVKIIIDPMFIDDDPIAEAVQKLTYNEFLETPYWKTITEYKKGFADYKCQLCGSSKNTCTHHKTYRRHGYEHNTNVINEDLIVLCKDCHKEIHNICEDDEI